MKRSASRLTLATVLLIAAVAMVAQFGSVPHLHRGDEVGIYNAEHDLTLLSALAGYGLPADTAPALAFEPVFTPLLPFVPESLATRPVHSAGSRAPPAA